MLHEKPEAGFLLEMDLAVCPENYSIRKLTVSYSDAFKRLINVLGYISSNLSFAMNTGDHTNVVFCKSANSLMSRVTTSPSSIVTDIVERDAYISLLRWISERAYYLNRNNHMLDFNVPICEQ